MLTHGGKHKIKFYDEFLRGARLKFDHSFSLVEPLHIDNNHVDEYTTD